MTIQITSHQIQTDISIFSGGEVHVQLNDQLNAGDLTHSKAIDIRADIRSSDDLMSLLLVHNALMNKKKEGEVLQVNVEIPYFPYARQDRVCAVGQAFSLQVVAKLINDLDLHALTVWDAHSILTEELTGANNISQAEILSSHQVLSDLLKSNNTVLICPDKGAIKKCQEVAQTFSISEIAYAEKIRDPKTGEISNTQLTSENIKGKTAVIIDDICDGGRTFIEIAKILKKKQCDRVILYVTHGIFSKGLEVFDGLIDEIFTTNSFPQKEDNKLTIIDFSCNTNKRSAKI
ncbi:MAG: ribose-phosphate diphosphokinase [Cocleimonas sp.]